MWEIKRDKSLTSSKTLCTSCQARCERKEKKKKKKREREREIDDGTRGKKKEKDWMERACKEKSHTKS